MDRYVIIVAAGSGTRVGGPVAKQFLPVDGKPVLMHTIEAFKEVENIIVVLSAGAVEYWEELCRQYGFTIPVQIVTGGAERFDSVKNALSLIPDDTIVAIHDGVRPFVTTDVIEEAFETAEKFGAAVPVVDCVDSVRLMSEDGCSSIPFDRSRVKMVQTPQVFKASIVKRAYTADYDPSFTDDASVVERAGYKINLTHGCKENIKITFKEDFKR